MNMVIRKACVDDLESIYDIQLYSYCEDLIEDKGLFLKIIEMGYSLVAEVDGGMVVGYMLCHPTVKDMVYLFDHPVCVPECKSWMYIHDLSVHPDFRCLRIGAQLVEYFEKQMCDRDVIGIQLFAVKNAEWYWNKLGYEECDVVVARGGGVLMEKVRLSQTIQA